MEKINGWDEAQAFTGDFETLEAGGYELVLKSVMPAKTKTGRNAVTIYFDIAAGDHKGYYERSYRNDSRADKRWSGQAMQCTDDKGLSFFKGFITSVEESNKGFKWDWDEEKLKGKAVGGIFRREQYQKQDGSTAWNTKLFRFTSIERIRSGVEAPEDKPLANAAPVGAYVPQNYGNPANVAFQELASDDDLPF